MASLAVVTDIDNNGIADLLWNGRHFRWALRGTGGGHFVYANREWGIEDKSAASEDDGLCFGDMDGDLDLVGYTGSVDASVEFYPYGKRVEQKAVPANSTVEIQEEQ